MRMCRPGPGVRSWKHLVLAWWCVWVVVTCGTGVSSEQETQPPTKTHTISPPKLFTGRICCTNNSSTCLEPTVSTDFSPFMYFNQTLVPSGEITTWTREEPFHCDPGHYLDYMHINVTSRAPPLLFGRGGDINLYYKDTFSKTTLDFCMEQRVSGEYYAGICRPNLKEICQETKCVTKCCGLKEEYSPSDRVCRVVENNNSTFSLNYETIYGNPTKPSSPHVVVSRVPTCYPIVSLNPSSDDLDRFYLLTDGSIYQESTGQKHDIENYCLEYNADEGAMIALVCVEKKSRALLVKETLQTVGVAISAVFLLVTVILHLAISDLRDIQGLCLLSHMISLLIADVALFTSFQFSNHMSKIHCVINGLILQYFFLVAFFWLSAMCFDIWRVIRATVKMIPLSGILKNDKRKFCFYSLYSWGVPGIISIITVALHASPLEPSVTTPGFGEISCWFRGDIELLAYFYGFVSFLFAANLVLLLHTMWMLHQAGGSLQCCVKQHLLDTSFNRHHVQAFWQRFSLFLVMALCWITEVLSWKIPPEEIWIPTDVLNSLQGFMVFVIVIASKKKRDMMKKAWNKTVDSAVRKMSSSDSSGVTWHVNTSAVGLSSPQYGSQGSQESNK
ncbi:hypothetical protein Pcinc_022271 [Petrolisthes cinctipes]|uniref:G-protein coupled receptors family 2 profile 2 domain-containing protein n=1 Tax=Petrolisthes cinctipes TaxID=88211 RepID=A0AAE1FFU0_PETCI|nr:hypothetical protein Pcinc_022271 [Petrolisthes cinctipes]